MTYGNAADTPPDTPRLARITLHTLQKMAQAGDRITMLTSYDASFTALLERAGVETILVGDSLGMVIQGRDSTLAVSMRDMVYHTECVARTARRAFVIADMPFGSFQVSPQQAFENAALLMAAGAQMVMAVMDRLLSGLMKLTGVPPRLRLAPLEKLKSKPPMR